MLVQKKLSGLQGIFLTAAILPAATGQNCKQGWASPCLNSILMQKTCSLCSYWRLCLWYQKQIILSINDCKHNCQHNHCYPPFLVLNLMHWTFKCFKPSLSEMLCCVSVIFLTDWQELLRTITHMWKVWGTAWKTFEMPDSKAVNTFSYPVPVYYTVYCTEAAT